MNEINKKVFDLAKIHEACKPKLELIPNLSVEELLKMYVANTDYSLCSEFLTAEFMKNNATRRQLINAGIFVDENPIGFIMKNDTSIFLGNCHVSFRCSEYNANKIYVKDQSHVDFDCSDNSFTVIDCLNDSSIAIVASDDAKVYVSVYGNAMVTFEKSERAVVKVVYKEADHY